MPRIVIGGDVCPVGANQQLFIEGNSSRLFNDLADQFDDADLSIVNLECPLISEPSPSRKSGPTLGVNQACINGVKASGIDVVGLANNHAMDHQWLGLQNTLRVCEANGIETVGAGKNLEAAGTILVRNVHGLRVGILALAEHEFGIADHDCGGVNPLDPIAFVRAIQTHRSAFDYLIVLLHGGNEHFQYPRPSLVNVCRFFIEQGANCVICQHSHCTGCYERYRDGHIVYGQGNLLFDEPNAPTSFYEGVLVSLEVDSPANVEMKLVPFVQSEGDQPGARRMGKSREERFLTEIKKRSREISDPAIVAERWRTFCAEQERFYLRRLGGLHRGLRILDRLTHFTRFFYSRWPLRVEHLNLVRCESHREVLIKILSSK